MKKSLGQRQIPTILGIAVLVIALIGGVALIGTGGGVFAPRAAPQTTPKSLKLTNVRDTSFTVSFLTDEATVGFVKYGTDPTALKLQASDDRDQLSGNVGQFTSHYITVRDLQPGTPYYFTLGTGSNPAFNNNGQPYTVTTFKKLGNPPAAKTIYGNVVAGGNTPASGAMVYVSIPRVGELSSLVKDSGSWAIPLSTARSEDGSQYAQVSAADTLSIFVQGAGANSTAQASVTFAESQPVKTITLGSAATTTATTGTSGSSTIGLGGASPAPATLPSPSPADAIPNYAMTTTGGTGGNTIATQNPTSATAMSATESATSTVVNVNATAPQLVDTAQPVIVGQAAPNITVKVTINSTTQISTTATTDTAGKYMIDLEALKKSLEPGEHTITITYTDPQTGKTVTDQQTFTVQPDTALLTGTGGAATSGDLLALATSPSPVPYGTSNPYPFEEASPSPSTKVSPSPKASPRVSVPATDSAIPRSGSTSTTVALLFAGGFFMLAGAFSFFHNGRTESIDVDPEYSNMPRTDVPNLERDQDLYG